MSGFEEALNQRRRYETGSYYRRAPAADIGDIDGDQAAVDLKPTNYLGAYHGSERQN